MIKLGIIFQTFSLLILYTSIYANELELRQLNVIFRHGDRTPETFPKRFPNDPHMFDSFYPMGSGGLTNEGKQRMYNLGKFLRRRYMNFLGTEYKESKLFAISSSVSRTKMSLLLVLSSLYPTSLSSRRWHDTLDWQPIPTHYCHFKNDQFFNRDKCELFIDEFKKVYNSSEIQTKLKGFETFLEYLRVTVGKKTAITFNDIILLHNNLDIEKKMNLTMQPWMNEVLDDARLKQMRMFFYEINGHNHLLRRLRSGVLVRRIAEDMLKATNKTLNYEEKISLYSGHDTTIISLLQALDIFDPHLPEFSSAIIFELLSKNEQYYVKVLYYFGIPEEIKTLTIPGCELLCPIDQFLTITKSIHALDHELHCKINSDSYFSDTD